MNGENKLYGLMAEFERPEEVVAAARRAYQEGYRRMDAYTPFPVEGLAEELGSPGSLVPAIVLTGGIVGGLSGYFMQWFATVIDYPLNVGGRPLHSWPAYIPITFELTVLTASLCALVGMLALNRLPEPYHPVFNAPGFEHATQDRFFLCIEAMDPKFKEQEVRKFLEGLKPRRIMEVEA
ncbi:MAG: hypothetical protein JWQ04_1264 [Pedosphaera sp.]|nr:hypothetical protein [Pedosphaera sp.]